MLEHISLLKSRAIQQNPFLREQLIDTVQPFLRIAAAALQNQAFGIGHVPQFIGCDMLHARSSSKPS